MNQNYSASPARRGANGQFGMKNIVIKNTIKNAVIWLLSGMLMSSLALAGGDASDGHSHADDAPPAPVQSNALRAEAATENFELVAVNENGTLTLYLNDFASNAPLVKAEVEVELNGNSVAAKQTAAGVYTLSLPALNAAGQHALTVSVTAGEVADLLLLTLDNTAAAAPATQHAQWLRYWPWLAGAGVLVAILLGVWHFRRRYNVDHPVGRTLAGVGLVGLLTLSLSPQPASAGGDASDGHSHADDAPKVDSAVSNRAVSNRPVRLPDGSVFMPKASQYQLGIRSALAATATYPRTLELAGHVAADPNASALVQAAQSGRIEAGPRGLPHLGMKVRRGEVLAWLAPTASSLERGSLNAANAELGAQLALAEKRLARLRELEGSVPGKEIEAAALEVTGLRQRKAALAGSLDRREALVTPVSGEIAEVNVSIGQVLEAREAAFSIVNRERLMIEALAYDPQVGRVGEASAATLDGTPIAVSFLGAGGLLKEHALPVQFRINQAQGLVVGQPVKVFVKLAATASGVKLPRAALVRNASGQHAVWLQRRAEVFSQQAVEIEPLDAAHVVVRGVPEGARVVVQGASLLGQVR